jgi:hypothetical protein
MELETGTSAERCGGLNTRRLTARPVQRAVTRRPGQGTAQVPLRPF